MMAFPHCEPKPTPPPLNLSVRSFVIDVDAITDSDGILAALPLLPLQRGESLTHA